MMGGWNSRMGQEQDEVGGETHQDQSSLFLQSERVDPSSQSNEISVHKFKMPDNPENDENQHKLLNEKVAADGIPFQEYSNYLEKVDDAKLSKVKGDSKNAIYEDEVKSSENEYSEEDSGVYSNNDDSDENQLLHKSSKHDFLIKTNNDLDEDIKENIAKEKKTDDNSNYATENEKMQKKKDNPKNLKYCQPLDIDESKITDDIEKRQRILCKICKNLIEEYSMHNHIRTHGVRSYGDYEYDNEYYYRCKICDDVMTFSYSHIRHHVYHVHRVTLGNYKKKYLIDANTANQGIQNQKDNIEDNKKTMKRSRKSENNDECSNDIEDENKTAMKRSRKSENNDECPNTSKGLEGSCNEDSRFISDDIREMRKIKCKLCGEIVLGYTFDGHLGWKHKVTRQEYGSLDYINNVSYYRCKLCQDVMIFDFKHINYHVGKVHSTKLSDYKLQYMGWKNKMTYEEMVSHLNIIIPRKSKIQESAPKVEKDTKNIKIVGSSADVKEFKKPKPQNSPTASGSNQEITTKGTAFEDTKFVTDDIREMRKCKCRICGCLILSSEIRHHMVRKHKVPLKKCGPIKDINNSFYRCKICSSVFGFCLRKIGNHVRHMHRLRSVKVYKKKYMGWDEKTTYDQMVEQLDKVNPRNHQNSITSYQQMKIDTSDNDESDHNEAMEAPEIPVISEKARVESDHDEATETSEMPVISKKARVVKKKIKEVFKTSEPMKKHEVNEIKTDTLKRIFSDDVDNMCLIKCNICDMTMSSCKKLRHFQALHKDSKPYYTFVRKTYYRCPDCAAELLFCYSALSHHATVRHNTSLAKFKAKYLKKKPEKLNVSQMEKHNVEEKIDTNNKIFPDKSNVLESQMKINTSEDAFEIPVISKKAGQKTDINNKIFSDDVNNMCLVQCNICQMTLSSNKKKTHFRTFHKDSKPSYTYVRKTYYRCPDCERNFLFCYSYMNEHARVKHKISLKEFKAKYLQNIEKEYYSDNVSDLCQYRCLSCGEENIKAKESHIRKVHKKNKNKNFELMEKVLHRCKICNTTVIFNQPAIMTHLNKCHSSLKIRFKEYSKKYLNLESQMKIDASEDKESDHDEAFEIPVIPKKARVVKKRIKEVFKTSEPMKKHNVGKKPDTNSKIFSDDVDNMCLIKCNICDMTIVLCKKWSHFRAHHKDSRPSYTYVRKTYYRCPDCAGEFLFCSTALSTHANTRHNISLAEYKAKYLKIKMDKSNFTKINYRDQRNKEKRYSNNVSELCKYKCLSCGEENIEVKNIHTKNVHPEIKKKYKVMEKILHRCKICNKSVIFNPVGINGHLKKSHPSLNITFKKYSKTYLNQDSKTKVTKKHPPGPVRCTYCPILGTKEQIVSDTKLQHKAVSSQVDFDEGEHMAIKEDHIDAPKEVSEMTTEEDDNYVDEDESENPAKEGEGMKIFTNNVNLLCTSKCLRCKNIVLSSKRKCHIKYHHKDLKFSKKLFRFVRKTYHRCKLCNQELLFSMCSIGEHLRIKHNISTVTQYRWEHCVQQKVNQQVDKILTKTKEKTKTKNSVDKSVIEKKRKHEEQDSGQRFKYQRNQNNTLRELAGNKDFLSDESDDEEDELVDNCYSTDVHKMCLSRCLYCLKIFSLNNIRPHIYRNHSKSTGNNDEQKFVYVRKTYYRCRICGKSLLFSFDSIFLHVKNNHYMNLAEYKDKYMGYNKDKYVYRRRPVYQSLSITPEIKLESSSPSIKTEPGLVPEPEEQKSLYFLQQNSSVLPKQEPDSEKTATGTDTLIHKQASTETSSALSENNTNLNIETLKTGHEESDSRLENLENLEEQANSLENLKNSEDTVDTSEAHIPEDLENGVKKEEDCKPEFVFKCPFNPCPAFTIEEGLKDGRAANHCIKVHKARPRHLLKLKLNWVWVPAGHTTWRDSVSSF